MTNKNKLEEAIRKRLKKRRSFYSHLGSYVAVGLFFVLLNAATSYGDWWFYYPMLGWGIGLLTHYFSVFGIPSIGIYDDAWEETALQEELERLGVKKKEDTSTIDTEALELPELQKQNRQKNDWDESEMV